MAGGEGSSKKIELSERRLLALELRKMGASYRDIARSIREAYPDDWPKYNYGAAHRDVKAELKNLRKRGTLEAEDLLQLELEKLNALEASLWDEARGGDPNAVRTILAVMERRAKYLDLDQVHQKDREVYQEARQMTDEDLLAIIQGGHKG